MKNSAVLRGPTPLRDLAKRILWIVGNGRGGKRAGIEQRPGEHLRGMIFSHRSTRAGRIAAAEGGREDGRGDGNG
jgi:hypothetical protein